ncbi:hypothetical protein MLD38_000589 [Melastoma candidum]|uniref:Uncharacterized protein n=1 Tax=Melastoma candidum TaxID=119954 RepID=A0ACB9SAI2_9MYRT|nr:hypothetical protein MLD38_000589 [Melastoma candidum]
MPCVSSSSASPSCSNSLVPSSRPPLRPPIAASVSDARRKKKSPHAFPSISVGCSRSRSSTAPTFGTTLGIPKQPTTSTLTRPGTWSTPLIRALVGSLHHRHLHSWQGFAHLHTQRRHGLFCHRGECRKKLPSLECFLKEGALFNHLKVYKGPDHPHEAIDLPIRDKRIQIQR